MLSSGKESKILVKPNFIGTITVQTDSYNSTMFEMNSELQTTK